MTLRPFSPSRYGRKLMREFERVDPSVRIARGLLRRRAVQNERELTRLLRMLRQMSLDGVVEIGTHHGGKLYAWCRAASSSAIVVNIDLPGGEFGGGYSEDAVATMRAYARPRQQLHFLGEDSHDSQTLNRLYDVLDGRLVDFLMIDDDHTREGVAADFEIYGPLVRSGGVIAFHDIVPGRPEAVGGVPGYWEELKNRYEHVEFVEGWDQSGLGIGVVRVP